jgi:hypothetical protein
MSEIQPILGLLNAFMNLFQNFTNPLLKFNIACEGRVLFEKGTFERLKVLAIKQNFDYRKFYQMERGFLKNMLRR